ncbi:hypothetical protein DXG01_009371 [Tephrocybe rancida]|nr:hypothetical protein DXG01_009371 [Tephrocybe rancida]
MAQTAQIFAITATILPGALIGAFSHHSLRKSAKPRVKIPRDRKTWRAPGGTSAAEEEVWADLLPVLWEAGYEPWPYIEHSLLPTPNGFSVVSTYREHRV